MRIFSGRMETLTREARPFILVRTSPDGRRLVYEKVTRWDVEWRNYRGGQAHPVTIYTLTTQAVDTLPWQGTVDVWPVWSGDAIYFLSDRDWAGNVWKYDLQTKQLTQLTHYKDFA